MAIRRWLDPLAALRELVDDTAARLGNDDVADTVAGLIALADLVDLIAADGPARADPQRLMDLQTRCAAALPPPELALLPVAAMTGQLRWAQAREQNGSTEASVEPVPEDQVTDPPDQLPLNEAGTEAPADEPELPTPPPADAVVQTGPEIEPETGPEAEFETEPEAGQETSSDAVLAELIATRRFGLATTLAEHAGLAEPLPSVLRLSALADYVRGETGPCASRLRLNCPCSTRNCSPPKMLRCASPSRLCFASPSLPANTPPERCLTTLSSPPGAQLSDDRRPGRSAGTARRAHRQPAPHRARRRKRAHYASRPGQNGRHRKGCDRTRFGSSEPPTSPRNGWPPTGLFGSLLSAAATDDRTRRAEVTTQMLHLSDNGVVSREIDRLDAKHKGNSRKADPRRRAPGSHQPRRRRPAPGLRSGSTALPRLNTRPTPVRPGRPAS